MGITQGHTRSNECEQAQAALGFAMVLVLPAVLPKQVMWLWVWLPNLDTAQNCVPLPWYCGCKWVFQPTVSTQ